MSHDESESLLIVSCLFGKGVSEIYKAPLHSGVCVFMTNNPEMQPYVEKAGWRYQYIPFPLSDDRTESSLQAKYTKFMAFLPDFPEHSCFRRILYFDNKLRIRDETVASIVAMANPERPLLIRKHERDSKKSIWDEAEDAMYDPRYADSMDETLAMVRQRIDDGSMGPTGGVLCNTGLIYIHDRYDEVMPLLNQVYSTCKALRQPECQVVWSMYSEAFEERIQIVPFGSVDALWSNPNADNIVEGFTERSHIFFWGPFVFLSIFTVIVVLWLQRAGKKSRRR